MITLSHGIVPIKDMLLLNFCDSKGTINDNEDNSAKKEKFNRIKSFAEELDCYNKSIISEIDTNAYISSIVIKNALSILFLHRQKL